MEVLPCSGAQYVAESDTNQQTSGSSFIYDTNSNCTQNAKQIQTSDATMDTLLLTSEGLPLQNQTLSCFNSNLTMDTLQIEPPTNNIDGLFPFTHPNWIDQDQSIALWVKWRGLWQAGIKCARADWPLSTLRDKPTHDTKKFFVVFFPQKRNYSWADMLLVRSINEFPEPIAYRTHKVGLQMVKDLTVARRHIMQKLAVGLLNIIDQFHALAFVETARHVSMWKEFALEASRCSDYLDLGRKLLTLQKMILPQYINHDWLEHSFSSWVQKCHNAFNAETIELLKEELYESILWDAVKSLWDEPNQPMLGSEWKTWKIEVMKLFSTSNPVTSGVQMEPLIGDGFSNSGLQVGTKRAKLEVRRAEPHAFQGDTNSSNQALSIPIESDFFSTRETTGSTIELTTELHKDKNSQEGDMRVDTPESGTHRWDHIVVEATNPQPKTKHLELTPVSVGINKDLALTTTSEVFGRGSFDSGSKNKQCTAFIEAKGRQCVRWANEGDVYCCVHLASRFIGSSRKTEGTPSVDSPMCGGITVLGTNCKHRSLPGLTYCKKHRPRGPGENIPNSLEKTVKRKHEEIVSGSENSYCREMVFVREVNSPLQTQPLTTLDGGSSSKSYVRIVNTIESNHCVGSNSEIEYDPCNEVPTQHSLYCSQHLPNWLKRARNGKTRIISKDVFIDLLKECSSRKEKIQLHQACELFYKLFKSLLSLRNPVPLEVQFQWAITEASQDLTVGEFLNKLVYREKERLIRLWGFNADEDAHMSDSIIEEQEVVPLAVAGIYNDDNTIKCKICFVKFNDDQELISHWLDSHTKEEQWLFGGYVCAICFDPFTNKKGLESHVKDRHTVPFVEQCMLLQCIPCGINFGDGEQLWLHALSIHPDEFRMSIAASRHNLSVDKESVQKLKMGNPAIAMEKDYENVGDIQNFICRFCGLKFDLLPDLGRHHQAAHMGTKLVSSRPRRRGIHYHSYRLKSGRFTRPKFKKGLGAASYRMRNKATAVNMKKHFHASKSIYTNGASTSSTPKTQTLGRLAELQCSTVADVLFSKAQKTKPRPNNLDMLSIARTTCCKLSLKASLEGKFGILPERTYLKAAKLCSEQNIQVQWHHEGFACPNGCKLFKDPSLLRPSQPRTENTTQRLKNSQIHVNADWEVDECHYVINSHILRENLLGRTSVLCDDISYGQESVPVAFVVDEDLLKSLSLPSASNGQNSKFPMPWKNFSYITKPMLHQSVDLNIQTLQPGCSCSKTTCSPEKCDHVYLFDNDFVDARDIYRKPMRGRFPYDPKGRILLEEGYLVYECNDMCGCDISCHNRVLQKGVTAKLEVFKTELKGWAVRAREPILRGSFVCEYIGEVVNEQEAIKRQSRYNRECSYLYNIDAHNNDMGRMLIEKQVRYVIDATEYGNVSRFINHSCSPNLVNYQVLIESMECHEARIGLYANKDIPVGEEVTCDYHYELLPGDGYPCHCGSSDCRGRLC